MAANGLSCVGEFNLEQETFRSFVERMEMRFMANDVREEPGE